MSRDPVVYRSGLTDSTRWRGFAFRPGDVVLSIPSKCGTTWLQMICALLVFQDPQLPAPLTTLSPWLDMRLRPLDDVLRQLAAQTHRRFIKTHTPLDGLPMVDGVRYVVAGRHPLDVAVSLDHHRENLDRQVIDRLEGRAGLPPRPPVAEGSGPDTRRDRVLAWIHDDRDPRTTMHSLSGLVAHVRGAWERRDDEPVIVVHHAQLSRDLDTGMRRLADRLGIAVAADRWPALVAAAGFGAMRSRAAELVPDERVGLIADDRAFFRSGRARQWTDVLAPEDVAGYEERLATLAPADLRAWLHDDHDLHDDLHEEPYEGSPAGEHSPDGTWRRSGEMT